jgi:hypothetical protein
MSDDYKFDPRATGPADKIEDGQRRLIEQAAQKRNTRGDVVSRAWLKHPLDDLSKHAAMWLLNRLNGGEEVEVDE